MSFLRELICLPIRFYQRFLSPLKPATCRFTPTCSEYGVQAIRGHGVFKGVLLAIWRILRCHPFSDPGPDPIPEAGRWKADRSTPTSPDTVESFESQATPSQPDPSPSPDEDNAR